MKFTVSYNAVYKELTIAEFNTHIESGLMDNEEQTAMAVAMLNAVHDILPDGFERHKDRINKMTESLCFGEDE